MRVNTFRINKTQMVKLIIFRVDKKKNVTFMFFYFFIYRLRHCHQIVCYTRTCI